MADPLREAHYPGRERVISRDKAREILWREQVLDLPQDPATACQSPVRLPAIGLPSVFDTQPGPPLTLDLPARCRRCEGCLSHRRRLWTARAVDMIRASRRTWFGTLTVRPEERFKMRIRAERARLRAGREAISSLDATEQFKLLATELGREATKWLKRLRAGGAQFRYLLVFEEHKDGQPHIHVLLHEFGDPIPYRRLENQWRYGFSHWRLVGTEEKAAVYVCKYLSKDLRTRVRASEGYGQAEMIRLLTERIERMRDTALCTSKAAVDAPRRANDATMASQRRDDVASRCEVRTPRNDSDGEPSQPRV